MPCNQIWCCVQKPRHKLLNRSPTYGCGILHKMWSIAFWNFTEDRDRKWDIDWLLLESVWFAVTHCGNEMAVRWSVASSAVTGEVRSCYHSNPCSYCYPAWQGNGSEMVCYELCSDRRGANALTARYEPVNVTDVISHGSVSKSWF